MIGWVAEKIVKEMLDLKKYIKFGNRGDFVILDDDFTIEQLEAILTVMKGKK